MQPTMFHPLLCLPADRLKPAADFYIRHLGFQAVFESEWYVALRHAANPNLELALIDQTHESIPKPHRRTTAGLILTLEVEDAAAEYARLVERAGLPAYHALRDEEWGQRHFMLVDPNGLPVDVVQYLRVP